MWSEISTHAPQPTLSTLPHAYDSQGDIEEVGTVRPVIDAQRVYGSVPEVGIDCFYGSNKSSLWSPKGCFPVAWSVEDDLERFQTGTTAKKQGQGPLTLRSLGLSMAVIVPCAPRH